MYVLPRLWSQHAAANFSSQAYSNGLSEEVLGRAIKEHKLPRDEIVIMTKLFLPVAKDPKEMLFGDPNLDAKGYVNQYGLSRKVALISIGI